MAHIIYRHLPNASSFVFAIVFECVHRNYKLQVEVCNTSVFLFFFFFFFFDFNNYYFFVNCM